MEAQPSSNFKTKMGTGIFLLTSIILLSQCQAQFQTMLERLSDETLTEDGKLNFTQLTTKYGYKAEVHDVITEDGYILTIFHIPGKKPPILLIHGMTDCSDTYTIRGNISTVVTLAEAGYDIWVGNCRGNKYGRRHVKLDPDKDLQFWDFSWHEMGYYDMAAMIDYIRRETGEERISIIGHSQGSTAFFVLTSTRPEYNSKINVAIALGPGAFYNHIKPPFSLLFESAPMLNAMVPGNIQELFQDRTILNSLIKFICSRGLVSHYLCTLGVIFPLVGADSYGLEPEFLNTIIGHYPSGASRKTLMHYYQLFSRKGFGQYDLGTLENIAKYGTVKPPSYNMSAITMKVALIVGKTDQITTVTDSKLVRDSLPNVVLHKVLKPKYWNHLDYVWGLHMPKYLYPSILKLLEDYNVREEKEEVDNNDQNDLDDVQKSSD